MEKSKEYTVASEAVPVFSVNNKHESKKQLIAKAAWIQSIRNNRLLPFPNLASSEYYDKVEFKLNPEKSLAKDLFPDTDYKNYFAQELHKKSATNEERTLYRYFKNTDQLFLNSMNIIRNRLAELQILKDVFAEDYKVPESLLKIEISRELPGIIDLKEKLDQSIEDSAFIKFGVRAIHYDKEGNIIETDGKKHKFKISDMRHFYRHGPTATGNFDDLNKKKLESDDIKELLIEAGSIIEDKVKRDNLYDFAIAIEPLANNRFRYHLKINDRKTKIQFQELGGEGEYTLKILGAIYYEWVFGGLLDPDLFAEGENNDNSNKSLYQLVSTICKELMEQIN